MKNEKYFLNYNPKEDCYYLEKTSKYEINDWGYYVINNRLYSKKNKIIKRKWGRIK